MHAIRSACLLLISFIFTNLSAQGYRNFLSDFLQEDRVKAENVVDQYLQYDFSTLWTQTDNQFVYGIIGDEYKRLQLKFLSIAQDGEAPALYHVTGKSKVGAVVRSFTGAIQVESIQEMAEFHYGIDNECLDSVRQQGLLVATYTLREDSTQTHTGIFAGQLFTKWYLDANGNLRYDAIESIADGYTNNAFIGTWTSFRTKTRKICNWGDYRVPLARQDFDIGAGAFSVAAKYLSYGWEGFENVEIWW